MTPTSFRPSHSSRILLLLGLYLLPAVLPPESRAEAASAYCTSSPCVIDRCMDLDQPDYTYHLGRSVRCGTGFVIRAPRITLDLKQQTLTYNDLPAADLVNGDFESGAGERDVPGWTLENAPSARRIDGTLVRPVQVYSGNRSILFPIRSGSARAEWIESLRPLTLLPDTTYTAIASFRDNKDGGCGAVSGRAAVKKTFALLGSDLSVTHQTATCRGFMHLTFTFRTPSSGVPELRVRAGVAPRDGVDGYLEDTSVYLDSISIAPSHQIGVAVGIRSWNRVHAPDLTAFGVADGAVIKNGTIVQGRAGGAYSHAVMGGAKLRSLSLSGVSIEVGGPSTQAVITIGNHSEPTTLKLWRNTFAGRGGTVINRDQLDGYLIKHWNGDGSTVIENKFIGSRQGGIVAAVAGSNRDNAIRNNEFDLSSRTTNGFAISASGVEVADNVIMCIGDRVCDRGETHCDRDGDLKVTNLSTGRGCRGIYAGSRSNIHHNQIRVSELPLNQEYNGCQGRGAKGIEVEGASNTIIHSNTVIAVADQCEASAFVVTRNGADERKGLMKVNVHVFENRFEARSLGPMATSMTLTAIQNGRESVSIDRNTLMSNFAWIVGGVGTGPLELRGNCFHDRGIPAGLAPIIGVAGQFSTPVFDDLVLTDPCFVDSRSMETFLRHPYVSKFKSSTRYPLATLSIGWTTRIEVRSANGDPVARADVRVFGSNGAVLLEGTTDSSGDIEGSLRQTVANGGSDTLLEPYRIVVQSEAGITERTGIAASRAIEIRL